MNSLVFLSVHLFTTNLFPLKSLSFKYSPGFSPPPVDPVSNPDLRGIQAPEQPAPVDFDLAALVDQLQKSPELRDTLASVLSGQNVGKAGSGV